MSDEKPEKVFKFFTLAVFLVFMSVMGFVTVTAFSRKSGSTGMNMVQVQQLRLKVARQQNSELSEEKPL